jgi:hypothetical protein
MHLNNNRQDNSLVWLAVENGLLGILRILSNKLPYNSRWEDKNETILVQHIFQMDAVLRFCLILDIINGKPYADVYHKQKLSILEAL